MRYLDQDETLILRTARKAHRCMVHRRPEAHAPRVCALPSGRIEPGTRYVEYVGEVPAYQSGTAYCEPCARAVWARYILEEVAP